MHFPTKHMLKKFKITQNAHKQYVKNSLCLQDFGSTLYFSSSVFLQLSVSPIPHIRDLARGEQTCNVKTLTTECMDTRTNPAEGDVHVWNEISAQSVGVAAIKRIELFSSKVSSSKSHKILALDDCGTALFC